MDFNSTSPTSRTPNAETHSLRPHRPSAVKSSVPVARPGVRLRPSLRGLTLTQLRKFFHFEAGLRDRPGPSELVGTLSDLDPDTGSNTGPGRTDEEEGVTGENR